MGSILEAIQAVAAILGLIGPLITQIENECKSPAVQSLKGHLTNLSAIIHAKPLDK